MSEDSSLVVAMAAATANVLREMGDTWRQDDQFLQKFFPVDPLSASKFGNARQALYNNRKNQKRWKGIPSTPKSVSGLYTPLRMLMNNILYYYGISEATRRYLDTHRGSRRVASIPPSPFSPSLFLAGIGKEFANTPAELPRAMSESGVSPIEVALDSDDPTNTRDRLAMDMHQLFRNQENRRFAYGLVITQTVFTVYMFDHSGAVASLPCNYHQNPEQFCAVISGLASEDPGRSGFDHTIFADREGGRMKIQTLESRGASSLKKTYYNVRALLFMFPSLVGRGTLCWLTAGPGDATYVVKDAWTAPSELAGRESEAALLRHAQSHGVVSGIAQIHHFEEVRRSADASDLDTVVRNRRVEETSLDQHKVERIHTRIVMTTFGKTLDAFSTRMELLLAFHDAVLAHRRLHDVAGILHRDISVRNILINPDGEEGNRGILIDFDHAIRLDDTSPYSKKPKIGTRRYMSRIVLKELAPHSYLDDLESFYYVLCWILCAFERARVPRAELPEELLMWDDLNSYALKQSLLVDEFNITISPWFGQSLRDLAFDLHNFFRYHGLRRKPPQGSIVADSSILSFMRSPLDPKADYDDFLALIRKCVSSLEKEQVTLDDLGAKPTADIRDSTLKSEEPVSTKHKNESSDEDSDEESESDRPRGQHSRKKARAAPVLKRLRRSNTNKYR